MGAWAGLQHGWKLGGKKAKNECHEQEDIATKT